MTTNKELRQLVNWSNLMMKPSLTPNYKYDSYALKRKAEGFFTTMGNYFYFDKNEFEEAMKVVGWNSVKKGEKTFYYIAFNKFDEMPSLA